MKKKRFILLAAAAAALASCQKNPDLEALDGEYLVYTQRDTTAEWTAHASYFASLDLSSLMSNSETIKRTITMPEGCTNVSGEQEATIKVTVANKAIKQLRVPNTNFQYANVPQGLVPEARTSMLLVTIRADSDDIDEITEENIRVIADFSGVTVADTGGSTTVTVRIYVDGFETAGVIGAEEYSIVVDLNPVDG